jgi:hypothetical protein
MLVDSAESSAFAVNAVAVKCVEIVSGKQGRPWARGAFAQHLLTSVLLIGGPYHGTHSRNTFHSRGLILAEGRKGVFLYRLFERSDGCGLAVPFDASPHEIRAAMARMFARNPRTSLGSDKNSCPEITWNVPAEISVESGLREHDYSIVGRDAALG